MDTQKVGLYDWLQYFDKNPNARYISDGDPTTITIPISEKEKLNLQSIKDLKIRFYRNN